MFALEASLFCQSSFGRGKPLFLSIYHDKGITSSTRETISTDAKNRLDDSMYCITSQNVS